MAQYKIDIEDLLPLIRQGLRNNNSFFGSLFGRGKYSFLAYKKNINGSIASSPTATTTIHSNIYFALNKWDGNNLVVETLTNSSGVALAMENEVRATIIRNSVNAPINQTPPNFELVYFPFDEIFRIIQKGFETGMYRRGNYNNFLYFSDSSSGYIVSPSTVPVLHDTLYASVEDTIPDQTDPMRVTSISSGIPCPPKWDKNSEAQTLILSNQKKSSIVKKRKIRNSKFFRVRTIFRFKRGELKSK